MTDTNNLIRTVALDIISITTIWALINIQCNNKYNFYFNIDNKFIKTRFEYSPTYGTIIGLGTSLLLLKKYSN